MASQSPQNAARKNPLAGLLDDSDDDIEVIIDSDEGSGDGTHVEIALEDGGFEIDLDPPRQSMGNPKFYDNLAKFLPDGALHSLSQTLVQLIEQDDNDRKEWLQERADGLELLGMKIQKPSAAAVTSSTTAGQSTVRDPILAEAIDRFQANAFAELVPSNGPAKFVNYGPATTDNEALANAMSKDLNFYLCSGSKGTATEYAPDTRKMLWWVGYASGMFKKIYRCPIRRRPVSESVDGEFLIVPANVTDIENAGRLTHVTTMRQSVMKRMQILGVYRNVPLPNPTPHSTVVGDAKDRITGMSQSHALDEDTDYTVYECYCELDLEGYEHTDDKGRPTGLPLPYRVSIERDSRTVLEIRRNWDENDEDQKAKIPFVLYPYATGLSIYGTGLLQRLGNPAIALTAMLRELIDAGMFASFPGMLIAEPATRQKNTNLRVPPGGAAPIDVSATGNDINKAVMALPYKDPSPALVDTRKALREEASRYGNMADLPVGEGRQDAPVGTMLAMIEQGMKVVTGVLKGLHAAQKAELNKIVDLFREDPDALWRGNPRPALGLDAEKRREMWKRGLEICEITPASDPNEPSDMHRAGKAQLLKQMTMGNPMYDQAAIDRRIFAMFGIDDFDAMLAKGPPPQPAVNPLEMAALALKEREVNIKEMALAQKAHADEANRNSKEQIEAMRIASGAAQPTDDKPDPMKQQEMGLKHRALSIQEQKMHLDHSNEQANRDSREAVEAMKIAATVGVHPEAEGVVDDQLEQMKGFLLPAAAERADGGAVDGEILPPRRGGRLTPDDAYLAQAIVEALSHLRQ